jgi:3-oxoacyl-[acyl-carrier protein] reductase
MTRHVIDLSGQTALVTGGSRGIGRSTCLCLAQAGADVILTFQSDAQSARSAVTEIQESGRSALARRAKADSPAEMSAVFDEAVGKFGGVDIVVANAGIWKRAPIDEMTERDWDETMSANLKSLYVASHLAARHMKTRGGGRLILVSSTAGQRGEPFYSHYAASKGAAIAFTKALAAELGPFGIRVNAVAPGWVATDMTARVFADPSYRQAVEAGIPLGRIASPEQIASVILFLASELSSHLQGEIINVNGGSVLCG